MKIDFRPDTPLGKYVFKWWENLEDNKGDRALLRRADSPMEVMLTPPFQRLFARLERFMETNQTNAVKTTKTGDSSKKRRRRDVVEAHIDQIKKGLSPNEKLPSKAQLVYAAGDRWIRHQGEKNGFSVNSLMVENHQLLDMEHPKGQAPRHFGSLDFQGILTVTDPIEFMKPLEAGLGRSRGFGCGLLLIRRLAA